VSFRSTGKSIDRRSFAMAGRPGGYMSAGGAFVRVHPPHLEARLLVKASLRL
jgi:hypothetical protein